MLRQEASTSFSVMPSVAAKATARSFSAASFVTAISARLVAAIFAPF